LLGMFFWELFDGNNNEKWFKLRFISLELIFISRGISNECLIYNLADDH
jgi:hypothetical protein